MGLGGVELTGAHILLGVFGGAKEGGGEPNVCLCRRIRKLKSWEVIFVVWRKDGSLGLPGHRHKGFYVWYPGDMGVYLFKSI